MIIKRKKQIFLALFVLSVFLFQNCTTIVKGTSQKIPITSNIPGAKIIVDGEVAGNTPLNLKLKRKKNHVIRIEKQGYNPLEINTTRESTDLAWSIFGNVPLSLITIGILGAFVGSKVLLPSKEEWEGMYLGWLIGTAVGFIGFMIVDGASGANYTLSPQELNVTLTKIDGTPQPNLVLIDSERFQTIKWIRIKCDDSDGEDEIVNLDYSD